MSAKTCDLWRLVKFVEDGIWFACPPSRFRTNSTNECEVKWPGDGRWYIAVIYETGDEETITSALSKASCGETNKTTVKKSVRSTRKRLANKKVTSFGSSTLEKSKNKVIPKIHEHTDNSSPAVTSITRTKNNVAYSNLNSTLESKSSPSTLQSVIVANNDTAGDLVIKNNFQPKEDTSFTTTHSDNKVSLTQKAIPNIKNSCILKSYISPSTKKSCNSSKNVSPVPYLTESTTRISDLIPSDTYSVQSSIERSDPTTGRVNSLSNNDFGKQLVVLAQRCPTNVRTTFQTVGTTSNMKGSMDNSLQSQNSEISLCSQIDDSFVMKYGMDNLSSFSIDMVETSGLEYPKEIQYEQPSLTELSLLNNNIPSPLPITYLSDITDRPDTRYGESYENLQSDSFQKKIHGTPLQKKNQYTIVGDFSEEEPFLDSGSEYRPSTSFSEDTDGDSFGKRHKIHSLSNEHHETVEVAADISTQLLDFITPQPLLPTSCTNNSRGNLALLTSDSVIPETNNEKLISNIVSQIITCNDNSGSPRMNIPKELDSLVSSVDFQQNNKPTIFEGISVATVSNSESNRKWDKKYFCIFCKKSISKLPRHLYAHHKDEPEVEKILNLPQKCKERMTLIAELQNRGMFFQNSDTVRKGKGFIIPKRRPRPGSQQSVSDYIPCPSCFQMLAKSYLSEHKNNCIFTKEDTKGTRVRARSMLMLPVGPEISLRFREIILSKMIGDDVFLAIRNDPLILKYGEAEFEKLSHEKRHHRNISDRIRELGRLLIAARDIDPSIKRFSQLINANKYQLVKNSVRLIAGFNEMKNSFESPSLALKLGISLKKCASVLIGDYMEDDDLRKLIPTIDSFLAVIEAKWTREISCHAHRTLTERKWNAPKRLPLAKDIQILHTFLKSESDDLYKKLKLSVDTHAFQKLAEITLVRTLILNRRRVGEIQYMILTDYIKAKSADPNSDVFQTLSSSEKELSKLLKRLVIKGKKGRGVPVLFTEDLQSNLNLLVEIRDICGVTQNNPYLFPATRSTAGHFRAHVLLKKYATLSGCKEVNSITSTRLRKHIATMTQLLNLRDHELDSLANFMGHDIRVHREYYRLSDETVQLAKISKLLISLDKGTFNSLKGKNLDEINVDDYVEEKEELESDSDEENVEVLNVPKHISNVLPHESNSYIEESSEPVVWKKPVCSSPARKKKRNQDSSIPTTKPQKNIIKRPWSFDERITTEKYFRDHLSMKILPGKNEIELFIEKNTDVLVNRKWTNVKDFLYNKLKKIKSSE